MHCPLLRKTLVSKTTVYGGHWEMDRWARAPWLKSHVMNPIVSVLYWSEAWASIYGELQVTSRYHSGTLDGLMPSAQKTSQSRNFEFRQLLLACLGMGNVETPTKSPPSVDFQVWPSLALNALSPTEWNPSFRNHRIRRSPGIGQEDIRGELSRTKLYKP